jgi:PPP family 3-phenylpropionic acid transporter
MSLRPNGANHESNSAVRDPVRAKRPAAPLRDLDDAALTERGPTLEGPSANDRIDRFGSRPERDNQRGSSMTRPAIPQTARIGAYYFLLFAAVGVSLPYLPQHFRSLGFSSQDIGLIAAVGPAMSLLIPPLFGFLADRTRRPDLILTLTGVGVCVGNGLLSFSRTFGAALAPMALTSLFAAPQTVLIDSIAIERVRRDGSVYARLRLWGSLGFVAASFLFGQFYKGEIEEVPRVVVVGLIAAASYTFVSLFIRAEVGVDRARLSDVARLLSRRDLWLLCLVASVHWIACAPYNLLFVVFNKAQGIPPSTAGTALAIGVVAEVGVMASFPTIEKRLTLPRILAISFVATAVRWWVVGSTASWGWMVAIQLLHGLTFGAFYVAAVTYVAQAVEPRLRASGQAMLVASAFGVGGIVGYVGAGRAYDIIGGGPLFHYAGFLELAAAAGCMLLPEPRLPADARDPLRTS